MPFQSRCPTCGDMLVIPDQLAGKKVKCAKCDGAFMANPGVNHNAAAGDTVECPYCGEPIRAMAIKCKHCGEMLGESRRRKSPVFQPDAKSPVVAVLLEVLPGICIQTLGLGHIYAGNTNRGLTWMLCYWCAALVNLLFIFFFGLGLVSWPTTCVICAIFSSIQAARYCNAQNSAR